NKRIGLGPERFELEIAVSDLVPEVGATHATQRQKKEQTRERDSSAPVHTFLGRPSVLASMLEHGSPPLRVPGSAPMSRPWESERRAIASRANTGNTNRDGLPFRKTETKGLQRMLCLVLFQ